MSRTDSVLIGVALACAVVALSKEVLPYPVWITVMGVLAGGAVTAVFSWYFYRRASRELQNEAANLRRLNLLLFYLLDGAGVIDVKEYDQETGEPKRWSVSKTFELRWRTKASEATETAEEQQGR